MLVLILLFPIWCRNIEGLFCLSLKTYWKSDEGLTFGRIALLQASRQGCRVGWLHPQLNGNPLSCAGIRIRIRQASKAVGNGNWTAPVKSYGPHHKPAKRSSSAIASRGQLYLHLLKLCVNQIPRRTMYSRYIPPAKGSAASTPGFSNEINTQYNASPAPIRQDQEPPVAKKITFDDNNNIEERNRKSNDTKETSTQGQEDTQSKKRRRKNNDQEGDEEEKADANTPVKPAPKPPKREKKKKVKVDEAEPIDGTDEIHKRHRAVFEKIEKTLKQKEAQDSSDEEKSEDEEEVHDLGPIPQPEPVVFDESKLTYDTLPPWLSSPIRVTRETRCSFSDLKIPAKTINVLQAKGFRDAFAVQAVAIPMLTPAVDRQGDVVISAPTGSGKTLSYVLPMVQDISQGLVTKIRGIIVLPTRDLVQQVQATCDACASAFAFDRRKRVKIGTAVGNKPFKVEQEKLMKEEQKYDPAGYEKYMEKARRLVSLDSSSDDDSDHEYETANPLTETKPLPYHVVEKSPDVDILICTPGRLVEHIRKTKGFTLDYVRWLVVDEADKLLAQDYQQWLPLVMKKLGTNKLSYRDFPNSNKTGPRKVILSATMTGDLSLLNGLKLSRPQLVVLEGTKSGEHLLPSSLEEFAIKVRDPGLKPLYLVDLLAHINQKDKDAVKPEAKPDVESSSDSDSDSDSDADSDSDSDSDSGSSSDSNSDSHSGSDSSSDSGSDSSSDSDSSDSDSESEQEKDEPKQSKQAHNFQTTVLVFTKSNEAALRLSRLLAILAPDLAPLIGTLTSSTKTSKRAQILGEFAKGKQIRILVASDLVSRGIDLTNLDHVINYDLPTNATSYVHRVGRTARAGRVGYAWTLYEHAQGRRFWRDFVGQGEGASTEIVRNGKVERVHIGQEVKGRERDQDGDLEMADGSASSTATKAFNEERIKAYEAALEQLGKEARR